MIRLPCAIVLVAAVVFGCAGCAHAVTPEIPKGGAPAAHERLLVAVLVPRSGGVDELYQTESTRLDGLCQGKPIGCRSNLFKARRLAIGVLRDEPKADARVAGTIYAALRMRRGTYDTAGWGEFETLEVALEVEARTQPGIYHEWIANVGDWSYGVYVEGVGAWNHWVHVVYPKAARGWLTPGPVLEARVESVQGEIVRLTALNALWPDGSRRPVEPGNYLIVTVKGQDIEFRAEVESDFACGDPVEPPPVMPPTLRSTAKDFFNQDGSSRFAVVYTKGC